MLVRTSIPLVWLIWQPTKSKSQTIVRSNSILEIKAVCWSGERIWSDLSVILDARCEAGQVYGFLHCATSLLHAAAVMPVAAISEGTKTNVKGWKRLDLQLAASGVKRPIVERRIRKICV